MAKKIFEFKQSVNDPTILDMYLYGNVEAGGYDWWNDEEIVSETSADYFKEELAKYPDAKQINVFVNSFGGSVFEAMSIRNQLKRHTALVVGVVDGFAASAASFILTACDTVKMYSNTTQMLHNMWNVAVGNSKQLRKAADDMDVMMAGNRQAYLEKAKGKLTEEKLMEILDNETWLTAAQCLEIGLCDEVIAEEVNLKTAEELVQKMNVAMQQRINYNQKLSAQLKELVVIPKAEPKVPVQKTNMEKLMESYKNKNLEGK
ncbi:head maturation protease, ClpP-related [Clostridium tagluense]|uniref:ATP-dependent Clp protease proteolytic subunit n=1 Tax=Clostridium tagluense TaxID=360422 RepID=A0A401UUF1_9CLOT|nr:head maturation protease, ClpP-related [Clostridium tagluense]GCD13199.1 ATP-dependent Clp protease proteolytic subunit [Clostridium tagluense]